MSLRDDLQPVVDAGRQLAADLGFRPRTVVVKVITWSGGQPGSGTPSTSSTTLTPTPKVDEPPARRIFASGGALETGDLLVTRISRTYTEAELTGRPLAAGAELQIEVDGRAYTLVGAPELKSFGWSLHLRRRNRKAP